MPSAVHQTASTGFGKGTNELYDRARPSYPAQALQIVHDALSESSSGLTLLEPGSGTGIFTRLLLNPKDDTYPSFKIAKLIAIEPSEGMRDQWTKSLPEKDKTSTGRVIKVVNGSFDDFSSTGVEEGTVDGVIIAQAFHWTPDFDAALREIARYLKPNAPLILVWNLESEPFNDVSFRVRKAYEKYEGDLPQYHKMWWRKMFDVPAYKELFDVSKTEERKVEKWVLPQTEDLLLDRVWSKSYMTESFVNGQARKDADAEFRKIVQESNKTWIDKEKGVFEYSYDTDLVIIRRK